MPGTRTKDKVEEGCFEKWEMERDREGKKNERMRGKKMKRNCLLY